MGHMLKVTTLIVFLLIVGVLTVEVSNKGYDFCFGFMQLPSNNGINYVIISTDSSTDVKFTFEYSQTTVLHQTNKDNPYIVEVDQLSTIVKDGTYKYRNYGICINSTTNPLYVAAYSSLFSSNQPTMGFLVLPYQEILDDHYEYRTISVGAKDETYHSEFLLVASRDNTTVTIYPLITLNIPEDTQTDQSPLVEVQPGENHTVVLHRRQTLYVGKNGGADVTGTRIVSDKPLTVISGHEAGSVPSDGTLEPMAQQIPPTQLWGDKFMIVPFESTTLGSVVKIVASTDNTNILYECTDKSNGSLTIDTAGGYVNISASSLYCYIEANDSVLVGQFPYSPNGNTDGDTTMILVASIDQYSNDISFSTLNTSLDSSIKHYVSLIVPVEYYKANSIVLNGEVLDDIFGDIQWTKIFHKSQIVGYGCTFAIDQRYRPYSISRVDTEARFFVMVYGFGFGRSYGYLAGLTFPSNYILGFHVPSEVYSTIEFEGYLNFSVSAIRNIGESFNLSYSTIPSTGITPGNDYTIVDKETIMFQAQSNHFSFAVEIHDDALSEATEKFQLTICTKFQSQEICFEQSVLIIDDDVITLGISEVKYNEITDDLLVTVAIISGQLQENYRLELILNTTVISQSQDDEEFINELEFGSYTKSHTIEFDVNSNDNSIEVIAVLLLVEDTETAASIPLKIDPMIQEVLLQPLSTISSSKQTIFSNSMKTTTGKGGNSRTVSHSLMNSLVTSTGSTSSSTVITSSNTISPVDMHSETFPTNVLTSIVVPAVLGALLIIAIIAIFIISLSACRIARRHQTKSFTIIPGNQFTTEPTATVNKPPSGDDGALAAQLVSVNAHQSSTGPSKPHPPERRQSRTTKRKGSSGNSKGGHYEGVPVVHEIVLPLRELATSTSTSEVRQTENVYEAVEEKLSDDQEEDETRFDSTDKKGDDSDSYKSTTSK